jgi:hypothetical protein
LKINDNILSGPPIKRDHSDAKDETKKVKLNDIKEDNWCTYTNNITAPYYFSEDLEVPVYFFIEFEAGGFNKRVILDFIAYSMVSKI